MAILGTILDLTAPFLLLNAELRGVTFVLLAFFHLTTGALLPIGILPYLSLACATLFFSPDWPRRLLSPEAFLPDETTTRDSGPPLRSGLGACGAVWLALQVVWPLRAHGMTSDVLWTEQGARWSWRSMVAEKVGQLEFRLVDRATGTVQVHDPSERLTAWQLKAVATQPDLALQYAHKLKAEEQEAGRDVAIYADSWVSLNGRDAQRYILPDVDLTEIEDGWGERWWLVPLER